MERIVTFAGSAPSWPAIQRELAVVGLPVSIRMIDGLPAFPDEVPEDGWKELRVSTPGGMITLKQQIGEMAIAVWGNADEQLQREWEQLARACAAATV